MDKKTAFFITLMLLAALTAGAQQISLPPQIDMFQYSPRPEYGGNYGEPVYIYRGESYLRFWGWSADGKAAYSLDNYGYAMGGFNVNYYIMDLITDEIVYHLNIDSYDYGLDSLDNTHLLYNAKMNDIISANARHGIVTARHDFLPFPFARNNFLFSVYADVKGGSAEGFGQIEYSIVVERSGRRKTIGTHSLSGPNLSVYICGYFLSPYENRILVLSAATLRASGDVYAYFNFNGCHLDAGF